MFVGERGPTCLSCVLTGSALQPTRRQAAPTAGRSRRYCAASSRGSPGTGPFVPGPVQDGVLRAGLAAFTVCDLAADDGIRPRCQGLCPPYSVHYSRRSATAGLREGADILPEDGLQDDAASLVRAGGHKQGSSRHREVAGQQGGGSSFRGARAGRGRQSVLWGVRRNGLPMSSPSSNGPSSNTSLLDRSAMTTIQPVIVAAGQDVLLDFYTKLFGVAVPCGGVIAAPFRRRSRSSRRPRSLADQRPGMKQVNGLVQPSRRTD